MLIRAMIAAAQADHRIDDEERRRIVEAVADAGLGDAERRWVEAEMERPVDLPSLVAAASTPELARQVYLASRLAIDVDAPSEEHYLNRLAAALGLTSEARAELDGMV